MSLWLVLSVLSASSVSIPRTPSLSSVPADAVSPTETPRCGRLLSQAVRPPRNSLYFNGEACNLTLASPSNQENHRCDFPWRGRPLCAQATRSRSRRGHRRRVDPSNVPVAIDGGISLTELCHQRGRHDPTQTRNSVSCTARRKPCACPNGPDQRCDHRQHGRGRSRRDREGG